MGAMCTLAPPPRATANQNPFHPMRLSCHSDHSHASDDPATRRRLPLAWGNSQRNFPIDHGGFPDTL